MATKNIKEVKLTLPDGSTVRCYTNPDGKISLDMDDVMKALANTENKDALQNLIAEHTQSVYVLPKEVVKKPERILSDFDKKILKGLNWNPKKSN